MTHWYEWAIVAFIIGGIAFVIWRGGAANPVSTGALEQKLSGLSSKVTTISGRLGHVEDEVKELKEEAATTSDIQGLRELVEEKISHVRTEMEGHQQLSAATNRGVERIERILLEKALEK